MPLRPEEREQMRKLCKADPHFFLEAVLGFQMKWFHREWFDFARFHPKHVIEAPRGFGKSTVCTTGMILWWIICNPNVRILIISRTETQALRFVREIRDHMERNELLKDLFGPFMGTQSWTDRAMTVAARTEMHKEPTISAMGLEGPIAGGHWDKIIADDPFDEESSRSPTMRDRAFEWLFTTLMPTLIPGGSVGVRCTRYHYHDLAGRIERELATNQKTKQAYIYRLEHRDSKPVVERSSRWKVLQQPCIDATGESIWEERQPFRDRINADGNVVDGLVTIRADMRERRFNEQFMMICKEIREDEEETEFERAWFRPWEKAPDLSTLVTYMFVDPAFKSAEEAAARSNRDREPDFFAIGVAGFDYSRGKKYILDVEQGRFTPIEREEFSLAMAKKWKPRIIDVERTGLQIKQAVDFYKTILDALKPFKARFSAPAGKGDKVKRAFPLARAMNAGTVEWNPEIFEKWPGLVDQFAQFPYGDHDDFVDCCSGAYLAGERRPSALASFAGQFARGPAPAPSASRYSSDAKTMPGGGGAAGASRWSSSAMTMPGGGGAPRASRWSRPAGG